MKRQAKLRWRKRRTSDPPAPSTSGKQRLISGSRPLYTDIKYKKEAEAVEDLKPVLRLLNRGICRGSTHLASLRAELACVPAATENCPPPRLSPINSPHLNFWTNLSLSLDASDIRVLPREKYLVPVRNSALGLSQIGMLLRQPLKARPEATKSSKHPLQDRQTPPSWR